MALLQRPALAGQCRCLIPGGRGGSLNLLHVQFIDASPPQPLKPTQDDPPMISTHHSEAQVL